MILRSLLVVATPYPIQKHPNTQYYMYTAEPAHTSAMYVLVQLCTYIIGYLYDYL